MPSAGSSSQPYDPLLLLCKAGGHTADAIVNEVPSCFIFLTLVAAREVGGDLSLSEASELGIGLENYN